MKISSHFEEYSFCDKEEDDYEIAEQTNHKKEKYYI